MAKKKMTAKDLRKRLRKRYQPPEWVLLEEVRNQVGYSKRERYADAMALSTYPSRGLRLVGFEIKVSRSDVKKELRDVEKAKEFQRYCDFWYLVVSTPKLLGFDELPSTWGLIAPHGTGLTVLQEAPKLEPEPWPTTLVASMVRNAHKGNVSEQELAEATKLGREAERRWRSYELKRAQEDLEKLQAKVALFEQASGTSVLSDKYAWESRVRDQAEAFRRLLASDLESMRSGYRKLHEKMKLLTHQLEQVLSDG